MSDARPSWQLPPPALAVLTVVFALATAGLIHLFGRSGALSLANLLGIGLSLAALVTAGVWILLLAIRRSPGWGTVVGLTLWVPYLNLIVASVYARRFWHEGANRPAWLAIAGMLGQTWISLRLLFPGPPLV